MSFKLPLIFVIIRNYLRGFYSLKRYYSSYIFYSITYILFFYSASPTLALTCYPYNSYSPYVVQESYGRSQQTADINYTIEPFYDFNEMRLIVVLEFKGDKSGETKILLPYNFSGNNDIAGIKYLKSLSPNSYIEDTDKPQIKLIKHIPNSIIKIYYQVRDIKAGDIDPQNYLSATINKQYFHFLGETFFIVPDWESNEEVNFRISWNHLPYNWTFANSFGVNEKFQEFRAPIWKFLHSAFAGGDFRIKRRFIGKDQIFTAIRGTWKFSEDQLCDMIRDLTIEERNFWNDHNYPFYVVLVLPLGTSDGQCGICHNNSLSLFLSFDHKIDLKFKQLIAHETFHNWLGDKISLSQPEELLYWFKEGFCNYYTRLLLLRTGLITINEYAEDYNKILDQYFTSSVRYEKNGRILTEFRNSYEYFQLPFLRGDILAHNINSVIMKNTGWKKSLDDLMRELMRHTENESLVVSSGSLITLIRFYAGESALAEIMPVINSGAFLKVNPDALGPAFTMEQTYRRRFWLFGELYEIPLYTPQNSEKVTNKDMLRWFGIN
jgi:predicted metalloprotease with PDZ domain